jgi:hypothetical protein
MGVRKRWGLEKRLISIKKMRPGRRCVFKDNAQRNGPKENRARERM